MVDNKISKAEGSISYGIRLDGILRNIWNKGIQGYYKEQEMILNDVREDVRVSFDWVGYKVTQRLKGKWDKT